MLRKQWRLEESRALYQSALTVQEKAFGRQHPEVAECINGLGQLAYVLVFNLI